MKKNGRIASFSNSFFFVFLRAFQPMIGGSSGQERCSFEAYNWYPFCRFFNDKNLEKIHKSDRGLGRGGDLIFCISF